MDDVSHSQTLQRDDCASHWRNRDVEKPFAGVIVPVTGWFGALRGVQRDDSSTGRMVWDAEKSANGVIVPVSG